MSEQKKLYRNTQKRVIGGVCAGLGDFLNIDPLLIRIIFILLALNGIGLMAYFVMWLVIPAQDSAESGDEAIRANLEDMTSRARDIFGSTSGQAMIGGILIAFGIVFLIKMFVPAIPDGIFWPVVLIVVGVGILIRRA